MDSPYSDVPLANASIAPLASGSSAGQYNTGPRYYQPPTQRYMPDPYADYRSQPRHHHKKPHHLTKWIVGGAVAAGLIVAAIFAIRRYKGTTIVILPVVNGKSPKKMTMLQMGPPGSAPPTDCETLPIDFVAFAPTPKVYHFNGSTNGPLKMTGPSFSNQTMPSRVQPYPQQPSMDTAPSPSADADFLQVNGGGMPEPMVDTSFMDSVISRTHG